VVSSEDSEGTQEARSETAMATETETETEEEDTPKPKKKAIKYKVEESVDDWGEFQTPKGLKKKPRARLLDNDFIDMSKTDPESDAGRTDAEDEGVHQSDVAQTHQQSKGESR